MANTLILQEVDMIIPVVLLNDEKLNYRFYPIVESVLRYEAPTTGSMVQELRRTPTSLLRDLSIRTATDEPVPSEGVGVGGLFLIKGCLLRPANL